MQIESIKNNHILTKEGVFIPFSSICYFRFNKKESRVFIEHNKELKKEHFELVLFMNNNKELNFTPINVNGMYIQLKKWEDLDIFNKQIKEVWENLLKYFSKKK